MKISVVTPLYKSAPYIRELYTRCIASIEATGFTDHEIIFVNDASPDNSLEIAKTIAASDKKVIVLDLSRNFGQHRALLAGLAHASGDFIFMIDSDLEEDPEWISLFYAGMITRGCDVVFGIHDNNKGGLIYSLARRGFYRLINYLSSGQFPENVCAARLMTRRYLDALLQFEEREMYLSGLFHLAGFSQLPYKVIKHDSSPTTYSFSQLIRLSINAITSVSVRPLSMIALIGVCLSVVAFGFTGWVLYKKLILGIAIEGWASVMSAVLITGGIVLFFNGIMAIYIAKIFLEVKKRPRSIIREAINLKLRNTDQIN